MMSRLPPIGTASVIATLQITVDSLVKKADVETSFTDVDNRVGSLESTCMELSDENKKLFKVDDLENLSLRQNLRALGIPEGCKFVL